MGKKNEDLRQKFKAMIMF